MPAARGAAPARDGMAAAVAEAEASAMTWELGGAGVAAASAARAPLARATCNLRLSKGGSCCSWATRSAGSGLLSWALKASAKWAPERTGKPRAMLV